MAAASFKRTRKPPEQKPPRHLLQPMRSGLQPNEWVPDHEACRRIGAGAGGASRLPGYALLEHYRAGELAVAVRHTLPNGIEKMYRVLLAFWEQASPLTMALFELARLLPSGEWHYFVRRAELDKIYP